MTPHQMSSKLRTLANDAKILGDTPAQASLSGAAQTIDRHGSPEVVAATAILVRADLCKMAESFETRAALLREWARMIGEDP